MRKQFAVLALFLCGLPTAQGGEVWKPLFESDSVSVAIDMASIRREETIAVFRERQILLKPELDPASMRNIREVQYRRQIDCTGRILGELSRAVFSVEGTLMHYESSRPDAARWEPPQSEKDIKLIETVCGQA